MLQVRDQGWIQATARSNRSHHPLLLEGWKPQQTLYVLAWPRVGAGVLQPHTRGAAGLLLRPEPFVPRNGSSCSEAWNWDSLHFTVQTELQHMLDKITISFNPLTSLEKPRSRLRICASAAAPCKTSQQTRCAMLGFLRQGNKTGSALLFVHLIWVWFERERLWFPLKKPPFLYFSAGP